MWLFSPIGFFSIVHKANSNCLTLRGRVRDDLESLRKTYLPDLSETLENAGTDYPYRATVSHAAFAEALARMAKNIDYNNFKDEVASQQGTQRAHIYGKIWEDLLDLESDAVNTKHKTSGKALSFGGVVINGAEQVLLVEPKNHFDGYVWTLPKGRPKAGERPEETASREVREETGEWVDIVGEVPGHYAGGTTINQYFLMRDCGMKNFLSDHKEIASCRWASYSEARGLIRKTTNKIGMKRDLAVLDAAYLEYSRAKIDQQHQLESREPLRRDQLHVVPIAGDVRSIRANETFSNGEMDQIRRGHLSTAMEDKWNIFFENNCLYACRSWTGNTIFVASFSDASEGGCHINSVQMASTTLDNMGTQYALDLLLFLINRVLLGRTWAFPKQPGTTQESSVLNEWHTVGSEMLKS